LQNSAYSYQPNQSSPKKSTKLNFVPNWHIVEHVACGNLVIEQHVEDGRREEGSVVHGLLLLRGIPTGFYDAFGRALDTGVDLSLGAREVVASGAAAGAGGTTAAEAPVMR
jgi:hypothetical protein